MCILYIHFTKKYIVYFAPKKINVFDVSGAGDTFISVLSHYYSKSKNKSIKKACEIANIEAGKSVQYFGTQSINKKYRY